MEAKLTVQLEFVLEVNPEFYPKNTTLKQMLDFKKQNIKEDVWIFLEELPYRTDKILVRVKGRIISHE